MSHALLAVVLAAGAAQSQAVGAPVIPPVKAWVAPVPQVVTLGNGAKAWVHTSSVLPLVHVEVVVSAGSLADPPGKAGLAALTASMLEEGGAGARSPNEVIEAFDALGTTLTANGLGEGSTFTFTVLSSKIDQALPLIFEVLTKPRFDERAFASVKQRRLSEIAAERDQPVMVASMVMAATMYGSGPRGHTVNGSTETVKALTLEDVKAFYASHYLPAEVTVTLVGDVTAAAVQKIVNAAVPKPWSTVVAMARPAEVAAAAPSWVGVDKPGAAQTVLLVSRPGPAASAATLPALFEAAVVLGGSFTSRLNQRLREKSGFTYGAGASLSAGRAGGAMRVRTSVKTEVTAVALQQLFEEMKGLTSVSPSEQQKSRALLDAQLVEELGSGGAAASAFAMLALNGLPATEYSQYTAKYNAITADQLLEATKQFAPEGYTVVMVGDRARIEKSLKQTFPTQAITWSAAP